MWYIGETEHSDTLEKQNTAIHLRNRRVDTLEKQNTAIHWRNRRGDTLASESQRCPAITFQRRYWAIWLCLNSPYNAAHTIHYMLCIGSHICTSYTTQFIILCIQYQGSTGLSYLVALTTHSAHIASNWGYSTPLTQDEEISQQADLLLTSSSLPNAHQSSSYWWQIYQMLFIWFQVGLSCFGRMFKTASLEVPQDKCSPL